METEGFPDYASLTTFSLKRAEVLDNPSDHAGPDNPSDLEISSLPSPFKIDDFASITRSLKLKQRPWIVYDQIFKEKEPDVKQRDMSSSPKLCPEGVTKGLSDCSRCQKVAARWKPQGACTYSLEDAIVLRPNEEDFKDPINYIESIRKQVEAFGMCRIVPPSSWKSPSFFEEDDIWQSYKFSTGVQRVDMLQNHGSDRESLPDNDTRETKRRKLDYEFGDASAANFTSEQFHGLENFQMEPGPDFSLIAFKRYADDFLQRYFSSEKYEVKSTKHQEVREPSEKDIEGEYWRIVEKPTEELEVLYGSDAISGKLSLKSPISSNPGEASNSVESASNWDLINLYKLPGSLLSFEPLGSSGLLAAKLHIGMCFSCLPWTAEEHRLYKIQYLHLGAPRIWYSIAGCDSYKFEAIVKKHFPDSPDKHSKLLHKPGRQISPATLISEGIPVYRSVQRPGEFVIFFPGAYHSGFDCGFSCSTSTNIAPLDWLPHGQISVELYRENRRKTSISYDRILLRAADEVVKDRWESLLRGKKTLRFLTWKEASGKDGVLAKSLRERIRLEARCREYLSSVSQSRKMDQSFDNASKKLECSICCYDLYLSAVSCHCCQTKYWCLIHAKHYCCCPWSEKTFFFRYQISELNILADAVEGKLSAAKKWISENLGQALHWNKPNEDKIGMDPLLTFVNDKVPAEKHEASGSKLQSKGKEPPLVMNLNDSKAKAQDFSLKGGADDDTSSSSSDDDVEEYITRLEEAFNSGTFSSSSNKGV